MAVASAAGVGFACGPALRTCIVGNLGSPGERGQGRCPRCSARCLRWSGPIGVIPTAQWGKCPACRSRDAPPPAVVELAGAVVLGVLALRVHPPLVLGAACSLAAAGVVFAVVDARTHRLPDRVVVPTLVVVAVLLATAGLAEHRPAPLVTAVVGGAATFTFYVLLGLVTGGLGFGDAKAGAVCGLVLGWYGWEAVLRGTTIVFVLTALYLLALLRHAVRSFRSRSRGTQRAQEPGEPLRCHTARPQWAVRIQ